jgi:hypothetical protein
MTLEQPAPPASPPGAAALDDRHLLEGGSRPLKML